MPERKPDKIVTARIPTSIEFDGNSIHVVRNERGYPVVKIWLADRKTVHIRVAKLADSADTLD